MKSALNAMQRKLEELVGKMQIDVRAIQVILFREITHGMLQQENAFVKLHFIMMEPNALDVQLLEIQLLLQLVELAVDVKQITLGIQKPRHVYVMVCLRLLAVDVRLVIPLLEQLDSMN